MLYNKIRYANRIRKLYRLKNLLAHEKRPEISSRLGFSKYSKQYYDFMKGLEKENILDKNGLFKDKPTNIWIAELPLMIKNEKELQILGYQNPYFLYLALVIKKSITLNEIIKDLQISERTVFDIINKLEDVNFITKQNNVLHVNEKTDVFIWFEKYLGLCIREADSTGEISLLFDCVPAYIDGPHAYYILNYEPGRPAGPANMIIRTYKSYELFWEIVKEQIGYFKQFPKTIWIGNVREEDEIVYREGIPYNKNAQLED